MNGLSGPVCEGAFWHVRDVGLSPIWIQFFSVNSAGVQRKNIFNKQIVLGELYRISGTDGKNYRLLLRNDQIHNDQYKTLILGPD